MRFPKLIFFTAMLLISSISANAAEWESSADFRARYQSFANYDFDSSINRDRFEFDNRLYIKVHGGFGHGWSVFIQPQAVIINSHTVASGSQSFTQADLLQAYVQYNVDDFSIRLGRQQLVYGDQRLLGHLGWKDVARTFDGVKGMYHAGVFKLDVFAVHPADILAMTPNPTAPNGKSLVTWEDRTLIGAYSTYEIAPETGLDAYFINWKHNQKTAIGKGRNLNTFGIRLFGEWRGFDATAEAAFQDGTWTANISQQASAYAIQAGYTFDAWNTRIGFEYDYSPGDDKADVTTHKNFVFPFHTNHMHYGEMDFFSWGNMKDFRVSLKTSPAQGMTLTGDAHFFSLADAKGDWLNVVGTGNVFAGAPGYTQTKAGTEIDVKFAYAVSAIKGLKIVGLLGVFNPGAAVSERNGGKADSAKFGYLLGQYLF